MTEILGISASRLRSLARSGLVDPERGSRNEYRFSFAEVILLKTTRDLMQAGIPLRRVKRVLNSLRSQLPEAAALSRSLTPGDTKAYVALLLLRGGAVR